MAVGDKIFVADKDTLDAVNTKCTTIQTNTNNLNSRLTSTRAGYLDYLANGTYGLNAIKNAINTVDNNVDSIKTYTTTNNTASKTGILSQKSTYIINMLENTTYGLNAIKTDVNTLAQAKITPFKIEDLQGYVIDGETDVIYTFTRNGFVTYMYSDDPFVASDTSANIYINNLLVHNVSQEVSEKISDIFIPFNTNNTLTMTGGRKSGSVTVKLTIAGYYV